LVVLESASELERQRERRVSERECVRENRVRERARAREREDDVREREHTRTERERACLRFCKTLAHPPLSSQPPLFLSLGRTRTFSRSIALLVVLSLSDFLVAAPFFLPTLAQQTVRVGIIVLVPNGRGLLTLLFMKPWACIVQIEVGRERGCLLTEQRRR
jgi:hypothetical protein